MSKNRLSKKQRLKKKQKIDSQFIDNVNIYTVLSNYKEQYKLIEQGHMLVSTRFKKRLKDTIKNIETRLGVALRQEEVFDRINYHNITLITEPKNDERQMDTKSY